MMSTLHPFIRYFIALLTAFVLFASFYFQYALGMQPCPLCLMQRLSVFLLFALCFMGLRLRNSPDKCGKIDCILIVVACAGLFFACRQLWLQSLPEGAVPACMPGLDILLQYFPWKTTAAALFWGTGECARASWSLLGLSMPSWSALYFSCIIISGVVLCKK
jgi:protein dithiol:quinone oxidoreductase